MELLHLAPKTINFHCPYNASHTMPQKTVIKHLTRCPDKPPHFKSCPFNLSHVMPESELKEHEKNCPNRILIDDVGMYQSEYMIRPSPTVESAPSMKYEESWDGLENTSEVLKTVNTKTPSMKATHNMTKSQRKQHRINLHENDVNNLENTSEVLKTANTKTPSMKATHNTTKSQRKQHRINLHENDVNNVNNKDDEKKQQNKHTEIKLLFFGKRPNT